MLQNFPTRDWKAYNTIRVGRVVNRRVGKYGPEVQVQYDERQDLITAWIPVGQPQACGLGFYTLNQLGDTVMVAHPSSGMDQGVVLCAINTAQNQGFTPSTPNCIAIGNHDGQYIEIQPDNGNITITGFQNINISTVEMANYIAQDLTENIGNNLTETIGGKQSTTVSGTYTITVSGNALIQAPTIALKGTVNITGDLNVSQDVSVAGNESVTGNTFSGSRSGGAI